MLTILILILANGVFAMSEMAVVSARRTRLQQQANEGDARAAAALELAKKPDNFLSTVQIGITLIGVIMGAVGQASIVAQIEPVLTTLPVVGPYSQQVSAALVVVIITFLSLVLGELVPKSIALRRPEEIAGAVAQPMMVLSRIAAPLVYFLSFCTRTITRLLRIKPAEEPPVTEAELQYLMEEGAESGIFEPIEGEILEQLFRVGDLRVNALMIDRRDIIWLDLNEPTQSLREKIISGGHSRYPVARGDLDNLIGIVFVKDLLTQCLANQTPNLEVALQSALLVPTGLPVYDVLERFKEAQAQIAFVVDEHGGIEGLVTFHDMLEAIVGDVPEVGDPIDPMAIQRDDGSWLIDGDMPVDEFKQLFDVGNLPEEEANYYHTLGGFVMSYLGRIPKPGDDFDWNGLRFEVMDMDWRRVDKVLVESPGDRQLLQQKRPPLADDQEE